MRRSAGIPNALTVLMTMLVLFTLTGYQVTGETAATRLLGRLGASLVELDRWLPEHSEDIELLARDRPDATVYVDDLPVSLILPSAAVLAAKDEPTLRELVVSVIGSTLYAGGTDAFRDEEGNGRALGFDEPVRWSVMLLDRGAHGFWKAAMPISFLLLLAPVAGVLLAGRSPLMPLAMGAALAATSSLGAWFLAETASSAFDAAVDKETMLILRDGAWIGLRNSLAVVVTVTGLLFLTSIMGRPRVPQRRWQAPPASAPIDIDTDTTSA